METTFATLQQLKDQYLVIYSERANKMSLLRFLTILKENNDKVFEDLTEEISLILKRPSDKQQDYKKFENWREQNDLINDFLKMEIEKEKIRVAMMQPLQSAQPQLAAPEFDFSDISAKERLIIAEKLGIIDYIKTIQTKPYVISHTSEILSALTGINSKTLNTYLNPMLQPVRDDSHKDSPYKNPSNSLNAEKVIRKLKI